MMSICLAIFMIFYNSKTNKSKEELVKEEIKKSVGILSEIIYYLKDYRIACLALFFTIQTTLNKSL